MTKREVAWLIVKLAGLYFLWQAVETALSFAASYAIAGSNAALLSQSGGVFLHFILKTALYAWLGLYCVGNGRVFFHFLNHEPDDGGGNQA